MALLLLKCWKNSLLVKRFSHDLEIKTREQNRNNKRPLSERLGEKLACVASVSSWVRRERRGESKKKECSCSNFSAMTRLETLGYTYQVARLRRDCHTRGSKTSVSRLSSSLSRLVEKFVPFMITALPDSLWKIYQLFKETWTTESNKRPCEWSTFSEFSLFIRKITGDETVFLLFPCSR